MYSRSYNKNTPLTVPKQYGGVAFAQPKRQAGQGDRRAALSKPTVGYSAEAGERLYSPGDLPKINSPVPFYSPEGESVYDDIKETRESTDKTEIIEKTAPRPSFLSSVGALGEDTLMIIALIVLLAGSEGAGDTLILLVLLLLLG